MVERPQVPGMPYPQNSLREALWGARTAKKAAACLAGYMAAKGAAKCTAQGSSSLRWSMDDSPEWDSVCATKGRLSLLMHF
jgi:hypothetical protein